MTTFTGTSGNDQINVTGDSFTLNVVDTLEGDDGVSIDGGETVYAGSGLDTIVIWGGDNTIYGGDDTDHVIIVSLPDASNPYSPHGSNIIDGGSGDDAVSYSFTHWTAPVSITVSRDTGFISVVHGDGESDVLQSIERLYVSGAYLAPNTIVGIDIGEVLSGGAFNDVLRGNGGDDVFEPGLGGIDIIDGGSGNDRLMFGQTFYNGETLDLEIVIHRDGDEIIFSGSDGSSTMARSVEQIYVNFWDQTLTGKLRIDATAIGGELDSFVEGSGLQLTILGSNSGDAFGVNGGDTVLAHGGDDRIAINGAGSNHIDVGLGSDTITEYVEFDRYTQEPQTDLSGNQGGNTYIGGGGTDILKYLLLGEADSLTINVIKNGGWYELHRSDGSLDRIIGVEQIEYYGTLFATNSISGSDLPERFTGGQFDDVLDGRSGNDIFYTAVHESWETQGGTLGGGGNDTYIGGAGHDLGVYSGESIANYRVELVTINDGSGAQNKVMVEDLRPASITGTDALIGIEEIHFEDATILAKTSDQSINLYEGLQLYDPATGSTYTLQQDNVIMGFGNDSVIGNDNANNIDGGSGNDTITGNRGADHLEGGSGNDSLTAGAGNDLVDGGAGRDLLVGGSGAGNDSYTGGSGMDTLKYSSAKRPITVNLETGTARGADIGTDAIDSVEKVIGGMGADTIIGNASGNFLDGLSGDDALSGGNGNDSLRGGIGNDRVIGGSGNDTLNGGVGRDLLIGGAGNDTFLFNVSPNSGNVDSIRGFVHADDTIRLENAIFSGLRSSVGKTLNTAEFKANADGMATDSSDRIIYNTTTGELFYDPDGSGAAAGVKFATLAGAPAGVDHTDFVIT